MGTCNLEGCPAHAILHSRATCGRIFERSDHSYRPLPGSTRSDGEPVITITTLLVERRLAETRNFVSEN